MRPTLLNGIKWECRGHGLKGHNIDLTKGSYSEEEKEKDGPLISLRLIGKMLRIRTTPKGDNMD
jgi:hypothetical protein